MIRPAGRARRFPYLRGGEFCRVKRCSFSHRSRRVGSGCFGISRVGPGRGRVGSDHNVLQSRESGRVRIASGRIKIFCYFAGRTGSGSRRVGSGFFQISRVEPGQGRVGLDLDGFKYRRSGWVGSGRVGSGRVGSGRVGSPLPGPTREKPLQTTTRGTIAVALFGI